jgi:hypothetical protein
MEENRELKSNLMNKIHIKRCNIFCTKVLFRPFFFFNIAKTCNTGRICIFIHWIDLANVHVVANLKHYVCVATKADLRRKTYKVMD